MGGCISPGWCSKSGRAHRAWLQVHHVAAGESGQCDLVNQVQRSKNRLLGRISGRVLEGIPSPSRTGDNIVETSLAPVEVLNVLGFSGYRVVGVAPHNNKMAWTLERQHSELRREL